MTPLFDAPRMPRSCLDRATSCPVPNAFVMPATVLRAAPFAVSRIIICKIYKLAKKNRIPSFMVGWCVRFDPKSVANWLRGQ